MKSHSLSNRQKCDLWLILNQGFSPLKGFLGQTDYESVLESSRLTSNDLWPMPVVLDTSIEFSNQVVIGEQIALRDADGTILATMTISDKWSPDKKREAIAIYGTDNPEHPGVLYLMTQIENAYLGGPVTFSNHSNFYDTMPYVYSPSELSSYFKKNGIDRVVAFQTRNPMHRAHYELTLKAANLANAHLLLHPAIGETMKGDIEIETRIACYKKIMHYYPKNFATLSLLPLAMRMAGPREALWHAIIRKNFGCTHFIVGRDHAGVGSLFNDPYAAQKLVKKHEEEIGMVVLPFEELVYSNKKKTYVSASEAKESDDVKTISGTQFRKMLRENLEIPSWFSFPDIIEILKTKMGQAKNAGVTIFLTGLPSAGKSTIANALYHRINVDFSRSVSILDGDLFRKVFSTQYSFSKESRDNNIKHIGIIASEITKHGGIAICACIAPYKETREWVKQRVEEHGEFIEVYLSTPLSVCESRDPKNNYKKARNNEIMHFTGISDPYEIPENPDLTIDTSLLSIAECVDKILSSTISFHYDEKLTIENTCH